MDEAVVTKTNSMLSEFFACVEVAMGVDVIGGGIAEAAEERLVRGREKKVVSNGKGEEMVGDEEARRGGVGGEPSRGVLDAGGE